jgi:DNA-binding transcriptional regulator YhcF (GntR family)
MLLSSKIFDNDAKMKNAALSSYTPEPLTGFRIQERWGVVADPGFQALPDILVLHQAELGITSEELNVLLNLTAHWWRAGDAVFPRAETIAKRMGVSPRTVRRLLGCLIKKGFVKKSKMPSGNIAYEMESLKAKLSPIAFRVLEDRRRLRLLSLK